jgi:hypothetical protein
MKRYLEVAVVLMVCALVAALTLSRTSGPPVVQTSPNPLATPMAMETASSQLVKWTPREETLYLNRVALGESVLDVEARLGPPQFDWPDKSLQQWEPHVGNFTRIAYSPERKEQGLVTTVEASGTLSRGSEPLISFGDTKERMLRQLGPPTRMELHYIYHYPGFSVSCDELVGMIILGEPVGMGGGRD